MRRPLLECNLNRLKIVATVLISSKSEFIMQSVELKADYYVSYKMQVVSVGKNFLIFDIGLVCLAKLLRVEVWRHEKFKLHFIFL